MKLSYLLLLSLLFSACAEQPSESFELLIRNGQVVDGRGGEPYKADIGISQDQIVAMGDLGNAQASQVIDATGLIVSPGFIDLHSHAERDLLKRPLAENNIRQGVTTILGGNCGGSPGDIEKYLKQIDSQGAALNVGVLIGHNTVRKEVMQQDNRHATPEEMAKMQALVDAAMSSGAFGLSSGLLYIPGAFAPPEELETLAKVVKKYRGFYASHMRSEGSRVLEAVQETIDVGRAAGVPVHISHHKTSGPSAWGLSVKTLEMIDASRAEGLDVTLDQYPYTASNTNLGVLFPRWSLAGGHEAFLKRMQDPLMKTKIRDGVKTIMQRQRSGTELWRIQISRYKKDTELEGKNFEQVLKSRGLDPNLDNAADLAIELQVNGGGRGIYHTMQDADVERIMRHPMTSVASDGRGVKWQEGSPHPRNYGTYPRTLATYVRDKGVLSLPEAIKKMTALPAQRMGLVDRGVLSEGYKADVLIWDADTIQDNATFTAPHQYATGINYVIVNGQVVLENNQLTQARPGAALRHKAI